MRLLILGSEGMVGHVVKLFMEEQGHDIVDIVGTNSLLNNYQELGKFIVAESFDAIINCTAIINQDAETNKVEAIRINSLLPHFLEAVTASTKTIIVHRSTDCIFSGLKGRYTLEDIPDAVSFYARSKALGEIKNQKDITIRTSLIGPETSINGTGLFNWFYNQDGFINGYANSIWTGITTIEFAKETEWLIKHRKHGLFQIVPDHAIGKYDLLLLFEKYYPANRVIRRFENEKVDKSLVQVCGEITVPDYDTQISEMRKWTDEHKKIYRYE